MTIKKSLLAILIIAAAAAGYYVTPEVIKLTSSQPENQADPVIATINESEVHKSELLPYLRDIVRPEALQQWKTLDAVPPKVYEAALLNLAQDKLVRLAADKAKITSTPNMKALFLKSENRIVKATFLNQLAPQLVTEENIRKRYDELAASIKGKKEFRARHILLADKKEAKTIIKALKKRPFDELAKLFSLDNKTSLRGGDIGYVLPGTLNAEFEKHVLKLKKGKVSKPFKTKLGWHIAKLEDIRLAKPMPYENAKIILRRQLEQQAAKNYLTRLVANAKIKNMIQFQVKPNK